MDTIDGQLYLNQQATVPVGTILMFGGATPPINWLACDGALLSTTTYAALFNVIQYAFGGSGANFNLPNFAQRFPLGSGPNPIGQAGGSLSVTIATANLPAHSHPITDVVHNHTISQSPHSHGISDPTHNHPQSVHAHNITQDAHNHTYWEWVTNQGGPGVAGAPLAYTQTNIATVTNTVQPNIQCQAVNANISAAATGITGTSAINANISLATSGTGITATQSAGGGTALNVVPPYQAINFIIKYQ
jgi:microcystin-dependent protein